MARRRKYSRILRFFSLCLQNFKRIQKRKFCSGSEILRFLFYLKIQRLFQDELVIKSIQVFDWRLWSSCSPSQGTVCSAETSIKSSFEKGRGNVKFDLDLDSPCDDASSCKSYSYSLFQSWYFSFRNFNIIILYTLRIPTIVFMCTSTPSKKK